jgi:hypothetical protein
MWIRGKKITAFGPLELWALFFLLFALKWNALFYPFFWDELIVYSWPAHWLNQNGLFRVIPGLHDPQIYFGHTPGFSFYVASFLRVFGEHFFVARSAVLLLFFLQLVFLYRLLISEGRIAAILGCLLYLAIPTVYSHSTQVLGDMGVASLGLIALYYAYQDRPLAYGLAGTLCFLMKETGLAFIVPIFCVSLIRQWSLGKFERGKLLAYGSPLLFALLYYGLVKLTTGNIFNFPMIETVDLDFSTVLGRMTEYTDKNLYQYPGIRLFFPFSIFILLASLYFWSEKRWLALMTIGVSLSFVAGIALLNFINSRYFLPILAPLCVACIYGGKRLLRNVPLFGTAALVLLGLVVMEHWRIGHDVNDAGDSNMEYPTMIEVHLQAAQYLEETFAEKKIYSAWPISLHLWDPFFGYVRQKMVAGNPQDFEVLVLANHSDREQYHQQVSLIKEQNLKLHKKFEKAGRWVEIWVKEN